MDDPGGRPGPPPDDPVDARAERLAAAMAAAWARGERPRAEDFLRLDRDVASRPRAAVRLVYEEVCLREDEGQGVPADELLARFPRWRDELARVLAYHAVLRAPARPVRFPEPGERLGDFRLRADLGRGGLGRVFLATQTSLADRPVVLKVTPLDGGEHLALARLQHTHIVPINGVQDFPDRGLRALCMPYLGGTTLSRLLDELGGVPAARRTGADLAAALDRVAAGDACAAPPPGGPVRSFLAGASYDRAVCWVGACLADALQYAHERGLIHLDVKPSNVLISADGQPLLLDFHLARPPVRPDDPVPPRIGGTFAAMSPEQAAAVEAVRSGCRVPAPVDARSDVYGLGLLMYEALGGPAGAGSGAGALPRLAAVNPRVPGGLAGVIERCLAADPGRRYPSAAALAEDLRAHLADRPLRGVAERGLRERWRKFRRRRPYAPAAAALVAAVVAAAAFVGVNTAGQLARREGDARAALADGHALLVGGHPEEAASALRRGLARAEGVPGAAPLVAALARDLAAARRAALADRLHDAADRARFLEGADPLPPAALQAVVARCHTVWTARDRLLARAGAPLDAATERRIQADLVDLVVLSGELAVRAAPDPAARHRARAEALAVLDEAEGVLDPNPLLTQERRRHAATLGRPAVSRAAHRRGAASGPRDEVDSVALGRSRLRTGDLASAAAAFRRALADRPDDFWPGFYLGVCEYRLGRYEEAEGAFRVCAALAPKSPECAYHLARARQALGKPDEALADYTRALRLDPASAPSALGRGLLRLARRDLAGAGEDLRLALALGADPAVVRRNLALTESARSATPSAPAPKPVLPE